MASSGRQRGDDVDDAVDTSGCTPPRRRADMGAASRWQAAGNTGARKRGTAEVWARSKR